MESTISPEIGPLKTTFTFRIGASIGKLLGLVHGWAWYMVPLDWVGLGWVGLAPF